MQVQIPQNMKLANSSIARYFVAFLALAIGCNDQQWPDPTSVKIADTTDNRIDSGHLVSKGSSAPTLDNNNNVAGRTAPIVPLDSPLPRNTPSPKLGTGNGRPPILAVRLLDHTAFGVPIGLFADQTMLMRSDGTIQRIRNSDIVQQTILNDRFHPMERNEFAQQLLAEFGRNYLVKSDNPYLIVARSEPMEAWSKRFRSLHHAFKHYCITHAIPTREIEFPLVAVVFGSRSEFLRYANSSGIKIPEHCVGYYFSDSNRILLYESADASTQATQTTICHEATHQLAFNMGLHQRRAATPLWLIEGLATMFESPLLSGLQSREGKSLWPASRQATWLALSKRPESVQRLVAGLIHNDLAFESDFQNAYTIAWAMTAYLSQRNSQQFGPYLQSVGNLPPFQDYGAAQRVTDFQSAFGKDTRLLTNKIIKYLESLE